MSDYFKRALRDTNKQIREQLPLAYQQSAATKICQRIKLLDQYRYAKRIALYHACRGEVDLAELWRTAPLQGKFCYFPMVNDEKTLSFLPATPATPFINNRWNIPEPNVPLSEAITPDKIDVILLPLVAFDEYGTRLGMGGGYYDRSLVNHGNALLVGVAYEFQKVTFLSAHPWDINLDVIITDQTIYWSQR